jgi:hypothetical protein
MSSSEELLDLLEVGYYGSQTWHVVDPRPYPPRIVAVDRVSGATDVVEGPADVDPDERVLYRAAVSAAVPAEPTAVPGVGGDFTTAAAEPETPDEVASDGGQTAGQGVAEALDEDPPVDDPDARLPRDGADGVRDVDDMSDRRVARAWLEGADFDADDFVVEVPDPGARVTIASGGDVPGDEFDRFIDVMSSADVWSWDDGESHNYADPEDVREDLR